MKASEVLSRYAAGERDFRRANLRGQSFKGQDLSGADFSEADIRSTNFAQAQLQRANFTRAVAGVQRRWVVGQLLLLLIIAVLAGVLQGYFGYYVAFYFPRWWDSDYDWNTFSLTVTAAYCITILTTFIAIARQGFTAKAASAIAVAIAVAVAAAGAGAVVGAVVVAAAAAGAVVVAAAAATAVVGAVVVAAAAAVVGAVVVAGAGAAAGAAAGAIAVASLLLGLYCSRRALKGNEKFVQLRSFGIAFSALGGTHFYQADLTGTNFTSATLKSTNFRAATLTHVCWHAAQKLDRARVGDSILTNSAVLDLLTSRNGYKKSYIDANLRGVNLNGVNLNAADLKWADLSGATLQQANLRDANLREVLAISTDFTGAYLTGACLEAWNIDHTTKLDQVDCQYIFLLEHPNELGNRERRPHHPDEVFNQGDFEKLYRKMINVVQVLFRNGMNPTAFAAAFQELLEENPDISPDSIQAIERKGNDALVTLEVAETADKAAISRSLQAAYAEEVRQLKARVEQLQLHAADLKEVALAQTAQKAQIFNQLVGGGQAVQETHDSSQNINVGRDLTLTGSTLNLGEISGSVTNTINQLPDSEDGDRPPLKELLTQLQMAIEADAELPDPDKADLLEQVQNLATAQQTEEPAQKEGLVRKAKKMFEVTLKSLPETAKIVEACSKLLPMILRVLGVPV